VSTNGLLAGILCPGFFEPAIGSILRITTFSWHAPDTMRVLGPFGSSSLRAPVMVDSGPLTAHFGDLHFPAVSGFY
jgi:hypothetical protein